MLLKVTIKPTWGFLEPQTDHLHDAKIQKTNTKEPQTGIDIDHAVQ